MRMERIANDVAGNGFYSGRDCRAYVEPYKTWLLKRDRWRAIVEVLFVRWQPYAERDGFRSEEEATEAANRLMDVLTSSKKSKRNYVREAKR